MQIDTPFTNRFFILYTYVKWPSPVHSLSLEFMIVTLSWQNGRAWKCLIYTIPIKCIVDRLWSRRFPICFWKVWWVFLDLPNFASWYIWFKNFWYQLQNQKDLFIWVLHPFHHCTGHITMGSLWAKKTSTYSWSRFCTVNCRPTASNYQLSHLRPGREPSPHLWSGRWECYHSATVRLLPLCHRGPSKSERVWPNTTVLYEHTGLVVSTWWVKQ